MAQADQKPRPCPLNTSICLAASRVCTLQDLKDLNCFTPPAKKTGLMVRYCRNQGVQNKKGRYIAPPCLFSWWESLDGKHLNNCPRCDSPAVSMTPTQAEAAQDAWA